MKQPKFYRRSEVAVRDLQFGNHQNCQCHQNQQSCTQTTLLHVQTIYALMKDGGAKVSLTCRCKRQKATKYAVRYLTSGKICTITRPYTAADSSIFILLTPLISSFQCHVLPTWTPTCPALAFVSC